MPGKRHDELSREQLERDVLAYASETYPWDNKAEAIRGALVVHRLRANPFTPAQFLQAAGILAAKLEVTMPTLPADWRNLSDGDLVTLADSFELAQWDWVVRKGTLRKCEEYFETVGAIANDTDFRDLFLDIANNIRAERGLSAIT